MPILGDFTKGYLYSQCGLMSGKFCGASRLTQYLSGAGMSTAIAVSQREGYQNNIAVLLGMLLPPAVDLTMRVGLGCSDYSTNITITVIGVVLSFAAPKVDSYEYIPPEQEPKSTLLDRYSERVNNIDKYKDDPSYTEFLRGNNRSTLK